MTFKNRSDAGILLAEKVEQLKDKNSIVFALTPGGVPIACEIAKVTGIQHEIVLTKKIGHPVNKEYAIGAASLSHYFILPHEKISAIYIQQELKAIKKHLLEMHALINGEQPAAVMSGKTVLVIDDGVATGNTLSATVEVVRKERPEKIVVAVPVATPSAVAKLSIITDDVIALYIPEHFYGVGSYYDDFNPVTDEELLYYFQRFKAMRKML